MFLNPAFKVESDGATVKQSHIGIIQSFHTILSSFPFCFSLLGVDTANHVPPSNPINKTVNSCAFKGLGRSNYVHVHSEIQVEYP